MSTCGTDFPVGLFSPPMAPTLGWHGLVLQAMEIANNCLQAPTAWNTRPCHPGATRDRGNAILWHELAGRA